MESNYRTIPAPLKDPHSSDEEEFGVSTFEIDNEQTDIKEFVKRIKNFCWFLISTSWILPLLSYFIGPESYIFIILSIISLFQIILAVFGLVLSREEKFGFISLFKLLTHVFFIVLIVSLVAYEGLGMWLTTKNNYDDCNKFTFNKVCSGRWGVMSKQMILIMILPAIDITVFVLYIYFMKLLNRTASKLRT